MRLGAVDRMSYWRLVSLLVDGMRRRENAVVHRAGFSNEPNSFPLGLWDKSNNLAHNRLLLCGAALWRRLVSGRWAEMPASTGGRIGRDFSKSWKTERRLSQAEVSRE